MERRTLSNISKAFALASVIFLCGCGLQVQGANTQINIKLFDLIDIKASILWKRVEQQQGWFGVGTMSTAASQSFMQISGENASIPNQELLVTIAIEDAAGTLMAARQFDATVRSGKASFNNANAVEQWLSQYDHLEQGNLAVFAPDIVVNPPREGYYTIENQTYVGGDEVASASVTGYVSDGGGDWQPPTDPY
ncbi:hypothetical protein [Lysobacter sp. D1-1-M9]|uniref:hypothetical protein n=1 Tax=Novilysobacter longmucuonensis TaxID=3098603 RepID=UPI002FC908A5